MIGYTRNGGTILGDGRIVMPNGQTISPNANGQYPWGQYAYYDPRTNGYAYDYKRTGEYDRTHRHDNGLHRGWDHNVHAQDNVKDRDHDGDRDDRSHGHHG